MSYDLCSYCDGTGERDFLSGARCHECNGTGMIEYRDPDDEEYLDDEDYPDDCCDEEQDYWGCDE